MRKHRRLSRGYTTEPNMAIKREWFLDKPVADKIALWCFNLIDDLGAYDLLIRNCDDSDVRVIGQLLELPLLDDLLDKSLLDMPDNGRIEIDEIDQSIVTKAIHNLRQVVVKRIQRLQKRRLSTYPMLGKNMTLLQHMMGLSDVEVEILECAVLIEKEYLLDKMFSFIESEYFNNDQRPISKLIAIMLQYPQKEIIKALYKSDSLTKIMQITKSRRQSEDISFNIDDFEDSVCEVSIDKMLKDRIKTLPKTALTLQDYTHIQNDLDTLLSYLKRAVQNKPKGINILIHGKPGTGKTELVKTVADHLHLQLFAINTHSNRKDRMSDYDFAQSFLSAKDTLLLYDEAEDIFTKSKQMGFLQDKAAINESLETNPIPSIWLTNNVSRMDSATLRRFAMVIAMPLLPQKKMIALIKGQSSDMLDDKTIKAIINHSDIPPALITNTAQVIKSIKCKDRNSAFVHHLNNTLKAQGYRPIITGSPLSTEYDVSFVNSSVDLEALTSNLVHNPNARLCLYGVPGTGKSAFAKYIAEQLNRPFILKKGSDLISMFVGVTEQNIALAFDEAREKEAVLVFDEVDSFLQDRDTATRSWEITQVNEMFTQMESFDGIFIATTNLMDNLDRASIRRFDMKIVFKAMNTDQVWRICQAYGTVLGLKITKASKHRVQRALPKATPGNFATVLRQHRFNKVTSLDDLIKRVQQESKLQQDDRIAMGF